MSYSDCDISGGAGDPSRFSALPRLFFRTTQLGTDECTRLGLRIPGNAGELGDAAAYVDLQALPRLLPTFSSLESLQHSGREAESDCLSWVRHGQGMVAWGRALTLRARGVARIEDLRAAWRHVVYSSWWRDALVRPGTGPVAFGTIAFAPSSVEDSTLVVPRILIGLDEKGAWLTCAAQSEDALPDPQSVLAQIEAQLGAIGDSSPLALSQPAVSSRDSRMPASTEVEAILQEGHLSRDDYIALLARVQARMHTGEADKVVIARDAFAMPVQPVSQRQVLMNLAKTYPTCWTFAVDGMVGASPELLVRLSARRLFSRVLAGTARRHSGTPEETASLAAWLGGSEKNNREHELARTSAITALEPLCSLVEAPPRYVLTLPNVLHLASDITGVIAGDTGALSLVRALHPTAAVGGSPRLAALAIIEEEESMDRGRYAGPVGWVDWRGEGEWCIALRSAQMGPVASQEHPARLFGGGGIMPDSDPADEYAETLAKMRPMRDALNMA